MTKIPPFSEPHSSAMGETQSQRPASHGASKMQDGGQARTPRFDSILGLHSFLGVVVCLPLLGLGFLLLETGSWLPFLSIGAASCAGGAAASGFSAYRSGRGGVMRSLFFALPVLLVGVVARIGLSPSVGLPLNMWCAFGVLMFAASYMGGRTGEGYGKKRHPKTTPSQSISSQQTALSAMSENEPPPTPPAPSQITPHTGMSRKWKIVLAFALGVTLILLACFVAMALVAVLGNELGVVALVVPAAFIGTWVGFFFTQFFLSYGNPRAVRKDWPVVAALNFAPFCSVIIFWVFATQRAALAILVVAGVTLVCSYAGAALATLIARRQLRVVPPALGWTSTLTNNPSPVWVLSN